MSDNTPSPSDALAALEATWSPATRQTIHGWTIRDGQGGGKRVSAATRAAPGARIEDAEQAMRAQGDRPLFMLRAGQTDLDAQLDARGYRLLDRTLIRAAPIATLLPDRDPKRSVIHATHRLAIMDEIWIKSGIGPARLAVMDRSCRPHGFLLGRDGDAPAGVGFVALHDGTAMLHALEVLPEHRRKGLGKRLTQGAVLWAADAGATSFALAVVEANEAANALYAAMGLEVITRYHYRQSPT